LFCFARNSWGLLCAIIQKIKTETSHIAQSKKKLDNSDSCLLGLKNEKGLEKENLKIATKS
ncbi:hypothetical protein JXQ70_08435, partial [bacterium]|nr:hypothetical protein [bacterium]